MAQKMLLSNLIDEKGTLGTAEQIGPKSGGGGGGSTENAVLYTAQSLSNTQKEQARANIGATDAATSIPDNVKQALLACFENVAWATEDGQQYYDALEESLYPPAGLLSVSAVFEQGETIIYDTDSLDVLKPMLTVTANYDNGTSKTVTDYTLSGTLTVGTSTITVSYGGKTTTFDVVVSEAPLLPTEYQQVEYIANPSDAYFVTNIAVPLGYKLHAKAFWTAKGSAGQSVCGGANNGYNRSFFFYSSTDDYVGCWYGTTNNFVEVLGYTSEPVEVETVMTSSNISINAKNSRSENTKTTNVSATRTNPLEVFRTSAVAPGNFVGRIYYIEVLDTDGIATTKLIPCYRKADNVVGMYDVVNNVFYSSANSTAFTKGGNV